MCNKVQLCSLDTFLSVKHHSRHPYSSCVLRGAKWASTSIHQGQCGCSPLLHQLSGWVPPNSVHFNLLVVLLNKFFWDLSFEIDNHKWHISCFQFYFISQVSYFIISFTIHPFNLEIHCFRRFIFSWQDTSKVFNFNNPRALSPRMSREQILLALMTDSFWLQSRPGFGTNI